MNKKTLFCEKDKEEIDWIFNLTSTKYKNKITLYLG